uniref:hypothetical protein n=1 Tax=Candidatus Enterococcus willemsii TaxID=1857215 RepID=UPI00403F386A
MIFRIAPLLFKTEKTMYCYDDSTKNIFPIDENEYNFLKNVSVNQELNIPSKKLEERINKLNLFKDNKQSKSMNKEELIAYYNKNGISHLCLILTEACDFRCKYCIYSDNYYYTKSYSNKKMTFKIAKKAIDYYIQSNLSSVKRNPNKQFTIGFYGGECQTS